MQSSAHLPGPPRDSGFTFDAVLLTPVQPIFSLFFHTSFEHCQTLRGIRTDRGGWRREKRGTFQNPRSGGNPAEGERDFFIDNLLVRINFIIEVI